MNKPYQPIACALHDKYEVAIMFNRPIKIKWMDDKGDHHTEKVLPKDILVKNGEEFLIASLHDHGQLCIRLDRITILE